MNLPLIELALVAFLVMLLAQYIGQPLTDDPEVVYTPASETDRLGEKKVALLLGIKELEMDFAMGKLTEQEYQRIRRELESETVTTLKALDKAQEQARATESALQE